MVNGCADEGKRRNEVGQEKRQALDVGEALLPGGGEAIDALGEHVGERGEIALGSRALLPALVEHLHESTEANGDQEGDD